MGGNNYIGFMCAGFAMCGSEEHATALTINNTAP